jgi:hypothetical protein
MGIKPLVVMTFIMLLSNPAYLVDNAHVNYIMTISATGEPVSISGEIRLDIAISEAGVAALVLDMQDFPAPDWTDNIEESEIGFFILSKADIASMTTTIYGETIALQNGGKVLDVTKRYYGANTYTGESGQAGDVMTLTWNTATGIILDMHAEMEDGGVNIVVDVEYQSSDVDIYSDLTPIEKGWNQFVSFAMTPLGIFLIVAIAAIIIVLCIAFKVPKKVKRAVRRH